MSKRLSTLYLLKNTLTTWPINGNKFCWLAFTSNRSKQEPYTNDTTHFINFIENTPLPGEAVLATFDVCLLYINIPQEDGIKVVCQYYTKRIISQNLWSQKHFWDTLWDWFLEKILSNSTTNYLQTLAIVMGTKMAVAFAVILRNSY